MPPDANGSAPPAGTALLAVKIDNVGAARPQTGLEDADIVYAEQVEGGLSRLMAVFGSKSPDVVGPVRSARETDLELLRQFDRPTLAYSGAQSALRPLIDAAPLRAVPPPGESGGAYFRSGGKPAPHNLYLRPEKLGRPTPGTNAGAAAGFRFAAAVPAGGRPETARTVRFPSARFGFDWSAAQRRWLVSMDGNAAVTAGGTRLAAATVVVQYVDVQASRFHDKFGSTSPLTRTVGSGRAVVLRDGRAYDAQWSRPGAGGGTSFTADGQPLPFAPGQVWVVFAKK
ncbi:DUF3048 domain-containing protein [Streptomyces kunmingensis]|uniref:DUF3048 domain-containing protein n=1 Tax=Streptomyces kunmingensis TaxID=68225 RepID=A0ABU6CQT0_9ACTN|nr:DUF3048 domain-containing protein [Streptomyces kunmingensis]MEB3967104.1 DUF3048 domain-containing protein [Streptomyces kunmingensis]